MRVDLPYLNRVIAKGQSYYYYRRNGQNIRISGRLGSPEFLEAYNKLHVRFDSPCGLQATRTVIPRSMDDLITQYRSSGDYKDLKPKSKKDYNRYLDYLSSNFGTLAIAKLPRPFVIKLRDKFRDTPRKANYIIQVLSVLLQYAVDLGWRRDNPALKIGWLKGGDGHRPWEEHEIAAFRAHWELGTFERTVFELAVNTGQRGGDIAKMRRADIKDDSLIYVKQDKTSEKVWIPISHDLRDALEHWFGNQEKLILSRSQRKEPLPTDALRTMIITGDRGAQVTIDYIRHRMREAFDAALNSNGDQSTDVTMHGLRYTTVAVLTELGCDDHMIGSVTGHQTVAMVRKYQEKMRLARLAVGAMNAASEQRKISAVSAKVQNRF